jgi:hypothetical protein
MYDSTPSILKYNTLTYLKFVLKYKVFQVKWLPYSLKVSITYLHVISVYNQIQNSKHKEAAWCPLPRATSQVKLSHLSSLLSLLFEVWRAIIFVLVRSSNLAAIDLAWWTKLWFIWNFLETLYFRPREYNASRHDQESNLDFVLF